MQIETAAIAMLTCLQLKHFAADYLLQPAWMLNGKGDLRCAGGYAHAGLHAIGSLPAYLIVGLGVAETTWFMAGEFVVHYAIDFGKANLSSHVHAGPNTQIYWSLHGADQLLHQLTYAGLILAAGMS